MLKASTYGNSGEEVKTFDYLNASVISSDDDEPKETLVIDSSDNSIADDEEFSPAPNKFNFFDVDASDIDESDSF